MLRDRFRVPSERVRSVRQFEWRSKSPALALWGEWDARGQQSRILRFVVLGAAGEQLVAFTPHMSFGESKREGLIATLTNFPSTRQLRVGVFDTTNPDQPKPIADFTLKNELL